MAASEALIEIAKAGHRHWCEQMARAGWRAGSKYDPQSRIHDGLVDFEMLPAADRHAAIIRLEAEGTLQKIADLVAPDRSDSRLFDAAELFESMKVGYAGASCSPPSEPGLVQSWEVDQNGDLTRIRVRWADGRIEEFDPFERSLRRLD